MKSIVERALRSVFTKPCVQRAHAHRFRHTLATELIGAGASFEVVADILGNPTSFGSTTQNGRRRDKNGSMC